MYLGITSMPSAYFFFFADFGKNKVLIQSNFKSFVYNDLLLSRSFLFSCSFIVRLFNKDFSWKKKEFPDGDFLLAVAIARLGKKLEKFFLCIWWENHRIGKLSTNKFVNWKEIIDSDLTFLKLFYGCVTMEMCVSFISNFRYGIKSMGWKLYIFILFNLSWPIVLFSLSTSGRKIGKIGKI